ncbi:hypothetical protein MIND_00259000 [Mycena indigotica]|uniref:Uncharacterized protein n=1 Tax=Mycena indigotica TaxID=2126181 RepID=A0A8H6T802_9AGAR|nr:uncharacterized protein MIND_00259000 [Mycena indigotica]KAF7312454.1 hypothetical protein MIND_00259000 [Mycena indigotica]
MEALMPSMTAKTSGEAKRLLLQAQHKTRPGSGFEIADSVGLPAVCALLASTRLNNTDVTFEAAQAASCLNKPRFKKLQETVIRALGLDDAPAERAPLMFESLRSKHCGNLSTRCLKWMKLVENELEGEHDVTDDELTIAIFIWVCNAIQPNEPLDVNDFKSQYDANPRKLRNLRKVIQEQFITQATDMVKDMESVLRTRASTSSPQKRTLSMSPKKPFVLLDSPSKRPKIIAPSPTKARMPDPPSPRSRSPVKSPKKQKAPAVSSSSEDDLPDELPPARRRRFRPVFLDTVQWNSHDPRIEELDKAAKALGERMVKLYGEPFKNDWKAVEQDEDVEMG